jgi:hypothetical protein
MLGVSGSHAVKDISDGYRSPAVSTLLDGDNYAGGEEGLEHIRQPVVDNLLDKESQRLDTVRVRSKDRQVVGCIARGAPSCAIVGSSHLRFHPTQVHHHLRGVGRQIR